LPGGGVVQAHGLAGYIPAHDHEDPDWALYLDVQWSSEDVPWPYRLVDWPDFGLPVDERDAFEALEEAAQRIARGELIEVACDGGTGRTGTALACLAIIAGVSPAEAVNWVRDCYSPNAVERVEQEELIVRFAAWSAQRGSA
jgi:protein-tyrosine phosphatase